MKPGGLLEQEEHNAYPQGWQSKKSYFNTLMHPSQNLRVSVLYYKLR